MSKAREYEQYAAECLRQADRQPKDRERWMMLAAHWSALAAKVEREENGKSGS